MIDPTHDQLAARDRFLTGESLKIKAFAGCGKTTTLELMAQSSAEKGLYVAFNRTMARRSARQFRGIADCMTTHALALRHLPPDLKAKAARGLGLGRAPLRAFIERRCPRHDARSSDHANAVNAALRQFCLSADSAPGSQHLWAVDEHLLSQVNPDQVLRDLDTVWASIADPDGELPLSHDTYLKWFHMHGVALPFDYCLVDEAQDLAPVIIDLFQTCGRQIAWVGDPHQELYAWRGGVNAMATIDDVDEVVLRQCFRFGPRLAELASALLADLGEKERILGDPDIETVIAKRHQPVRIVRNNMTLLAKLAQLSERNNVFVVGGTGRLKKLIADANALITGRRVATGQLSGFASWSDVQERAYARYGHPYKEFVEAIDKFGCSRLARLLERLPDNADEADITLTTVHGSKGCQFDAVSVYDDFRGSKVRSNLLQRMPAEVTRLLYVAVTRARHALFLDRSLADRFSLSGILDMPIRSDTKAPLAADSDKEVSAEKQSMPVSYAALPYNSYAEPPHAQPPLTLSKRSTYERYGDFVVGMGVGLFLWILFK